MRRAAASEPVIPDSVTLPFPLELPGGRYGLYDPISLWVAECNRQVFAAVMRMHHDGRATDEDLRLATAINDLIPTSAEIEALRTALRSPRDESDVLALYGITLFATSRCNLRCRYCYASAGSFSRDMPTELALAAVSAAAGYVRQQQRDEFVLEFHGGGEPTLRLLWASDIVRQAALIARPLKIVSQITTNGVLGPGPRKLLADTFDRIVLSCDGPPDIQDKQRPTLGGRGTSKAVECTIRYLLMREKQLPLRCTLTEDSAPRVEEILRYFADLGIQYVHLEPLTIAGAAVGNGLRPVPPDMVASSAVRALEAAASRGLCVSFSGVRLGNVSKTFCSAQGGHACITPDGKVVACFEAVDETHPEYDLFLLGEVSLERREFELIPGKVAQLKGRNADTIPECRTCFCRWHCAGGCEARAWRQTRQLLAPYPVGCAVTRAVTSAILDRVLSGKETCISSSRVTPAARAC